MSEVPLLGRSHALDLWVLTRYRVRQLRNAVDQQIREGPWQTLAVLTMLGLIWAALYVLLSEVLRHVRGWGLVGIVADQHLFVHFFLVLAIMLAFSNAILTFSSLYGRTEAAYLLSMPVHAREVVLVKWFEGLALSSWSFMLLGVPLMLAVPQNVDVSWVYYPLFLGHFAGFVAIPACVGLLAACAVALWAPRRPVTLAIGLGSLVLLVIIFWLSTISRYANESQQWLDEIFTQVSRVDQPLLPSSWTAKGVVAAMRGDVETSLFYLMVVAANGLFASWLTVNLLGRSWADAYSRAQQGRYHATIRRGWLTSAATWALFFYLPQTYRRVIRKDVRSFSRDPTQWSQMLIMIGLLVIYVVNLRRLPLDFQDPATKGLIAFLNLATVSLILATFTSRFVFPLLSLESQQLWLLELLPIRRGSLLLIKFCFALAVTSVSAVGVIGLAATVLELSTVWTAVNLVVALGVCIGLSGLAIGLGARFPMLGQRNPARIAAGFGGTLNLIASMLFVGAMLFGVAYLNIHGIAGALQVTGGGSLTLVVPATLTNQGWLMLAGLFGLSAAVAAVSLAIGGRHFARLEY